MDNSGKKRFETYESNVIKDGGTFKFKCKMCGSCCCNRPEPIKLSGVDLYYMAKELGMTPEMVVGCFGRIIVGKTSKMPLCVLVEASDGSCKLLMEDKCIVHANKPAACAMFPIGSIIDVEKGKMEYFMQQNAACPGTEGECDEHTCEEWLSEYDLKKRNEQYIKWYRILLDLVNYMKEKSDSSDYNKYVETCTICMYLNYDPSRSFEESFEKNKKILMENLPGLALS